MASLETPKTWIPYMNSRDCSQGFCSVYCPQWCSISYPPPNFEFPDDDSSPTFSPLVIAIIGILASAFLLVSYYTIISKYCGNGGSARRDSNHINHGEEFEDDRNLSLREPWDVSMTGLDEALIKSITVCKYKKGDGLIGVTDCSVCLSEFQDDESVRLLPKCSHAFHLPCIDTWLKSHSNCPLCRANIVFISAPSPPPPPRLPSTHENPRNRSALHENQQSDDNINVPQQHTENDHASEGEVSHHDATPKTPSRNFSDSIVEIRDEQGCHQNLRRSVSMDHQSCWNPRRSVAYVLRMNEDHQVIEVEEECSMEDIVGTPKNPSEENKCNHTKKVVLESSVASHVTMKRSLSSGRFFLSRH